MKREYIGGFADMPMKREKPRGSGGLTPWVSTRCDKIDVPSISQLTTDKYKAELTETTGPKDS